MTEREDKEKYLQISFMTINHSDTEEFDCQLLNVRFKSISCLRAFHRKCHLKWVIVSVFNIRTKIVFAQSPLGNPNQIIVLWQVSQQRVDNSPISSLGRFGFFLQSTWPIVRRPWFTTSQENFYVIRKDKYSNYLTAIYQDFPIDVSIFFFFLRSRNKLNCSRAEFSFYDKFTKAIPSFVNK